MKKPIALIAVLAICISLMCACVQPPVNENTEPGVITGVADTDNTENETVDPDQKVYSYVPDSVTKLLYNEDIKMTPSKKLRVSLAKNEYEPMQFVLRSDKTDFNVISITAGDLTHENGSDVIPSSSITVYREHYVYVDIHYHTYNGYPDGLYPDALIEMKYDYAHFRDGLYVPKESNQGYWLTLYAPKGTTAGNYSGEVKVVTTEGEITLSVSCLVYDFELSDEYSFKTSFAAYGLDSYDGQREQYYEFISKYRINPSYLPVKEEHYQNYSSFEDYTKAIEFAKGENIGSYFLNLNWRRHRDDNGNYVVNSDFLELVNYLHSAAPDKTIYAITADEPSWQIGENGKEGYGWATEIESFTSFINRDLPNVKTMVTFDTALPDSDSVDGKIMRYVPAAWCIKPSNMLENDVEDLHSHGIELWWYTCNWPVYPSLNTHIDSYLIGSRVMAWMEFDYGIDGYFCFSVTNNPSGDVDPWTNPYGGPKTKDSNPAGDSYLIMIGLEGDGIIDENVPVPTIRLEAIRDSMEDYEYLCMYRDKVEAIAATLNAEIDSNDFLSMYFDSLYNSMSDWTRDTEKLTYVRNSLAEKICEDVDFIYRINEIEGEPDARNLYIYAPAGSFVKVNGVTVNGENGVYSAKVVVDARIYRNMYHVDVSGKKTDIFVFPEYISKETVVVDFTSDIAEIAAANEQIVSDVNEGIVTVNFTSDSSEYNIPLACITPDVDYAEFSELRFVVSTPDGTDVPAFKFKVFADKIGHYDIDVNSCASGSVIKIPLNYSFKFFAASLAGFSIAVPSSSARTLNFSNISVIKVDDVTDPKLDSGFCPARVW